MYDIWNIPVNLLCFTKMSPWFIFLQRIVYASIKMKSAAPDGKAFQELLSKLQLDNTT